MRLGVDGTKASEDLMSSANKAMEVICSKEDMLKFNMIRGASKRIFYARRVGKTEKIYTVSLGH